MFLEFLRPLSCVCYYGYCHCQCCQSLSSNLPRFTHCFDRIFRCCMRSSATILSSNHVPIVSAAYFHHTYILRALANPVPVFIFNGRNLIFKFLRILFLGQPALSHHTACNSSLIRIQDRTPCRPVTPDSIKLQSSSVISANPDPT